MLGSGLATDAFSVSLADGLHEPDMKKGKACLVAGVFTGKKFGLKLRRKSDRRRRNNSRYYLCQTRIIRTMV